MTEIAHSGCKLLLVRRMFMATASSIVAQFFLMSCVILVTNLSVTRPLSWLRDTWAMVTCLRMWAYFVVLAAVILLQGVICSKNYLTTPPYLRSRFDALCGMFTPHNFLVGGLHIAIGIVLVWLHLSVTGGEYGSLSRPCKAVHEHCLVEEHYFLLLGGLWSGLYCFVKTNFSGSRFLEFLPIPQSKFLQVKRGIGAVLPLALTSAVWPVLYFLGLYYFLGTYFRGAILSALFLNVEGETLDSFSRLFDVSLIFRTWLYGALFVLTMNTMHLLFQACLTEWTPFEVNRKSRFIEEASRVTLSEAMAMEKVPIMQHLGYLDLVTLAQKDKSRRSQLFALSQPGGHPYNWNCIVEKILALVAKFTNEINDVCSAKQEEAKSIVKAQADSGDEYEKPYTYHMRNLVNRELITTKIETETCKQPSTSFIVDYLKTKRDNFICYLLSKPLIFYFFGKRSDNQIRHVLTNGQTIVWAVDAISSLAVVSLTEDPYGIVLKDLPTIIQNLLSLKQALDKLQKTSVLLRKPQTDDRTVKTTLTSLRMAVKRSIYRIVSNFGNYMDDIKMDGTVRNELENFVIYRE